MSPFDSADVTYDGLGIPRRASSHGGEKDVAIKIRLWSLIHMIPGSPEPVTMIFLYSSDFVPQPALRRRLLGGQHRVSSRMALSGVPPVVFRFVIVSWLLAGPAIPMVRRVSRVCV
jgi:hypothetical protein